jgi:UDP-4-amino-4,6-dideoxy-N-acetyl-beta-L-altrosamine transaminase
MKQPNTFHNPSVPQIYGYGRQTIEEDDIDAVVQTLRSDWLTQGPTVLNFENALSEKFGSKCTSAVANGTAGLHLIALGLEWKKDDIILTTPITFLASANCAVYVGARPDFVDIENSSFTIDPNKLESRLKFYLSKNIKVKAVVAVDYAGHPCNWSALKSLKEKYDFQLVNDFCHALGAEYKNDSRYAVKYADAVNLSFHPVKNITTGEGGAVITNNEELDKRIKMLRTHGMTKDESILEKNEGPWYYEMHEPGFNYRITDFQCALGLSQLKKLDLFVARRRSIADYYNTVLSKDARFLIPSVSPDSRHAYHIYPLRIDFEKLGISKRDYFARMEAKRIRCQVHYIPIHMQPFYRNNYGFKEGDFPVAEKFYKQEISIPMYPALKETDLNYITSSIIESLES